MQFIFWNQWFKKGTNNIKLFHKNKDKVITIDKSRYIYSNEIYDITIIELKKDEVPENAFLILDDSINNTDKEEINKTKNQIQQIYAIYYLNGKEPKYLLDKIKDINDSIIKDYCANENIPTGSPILNLNTFNIIGIHQGKDKNTKSNTGKIIIKIPLIEYNKSKAISKKENTELIHDINSGNEPQCILDIISQKFFKDKNELLTALNKHLDLAELTETYKNEVIIKFESKITKIFDTKYDNNTLINFMAKIKGLPNLVAFISLKDKNGENTLKQLIYLNGKIDLVNNIFTFENSDSFGYGDYEPNEDENYSFITFRP